MKQDLDGLRTEIGDYLESENFLVFHGHPRYSEPFVTVRWDSDRYPDYKLFLKLAKQLGENLIVFHHRELSSDFIDDLLDQMEGLDLPEEELAELSGRLADLRSFEGFTCVVELSFEYREHFYIYSKAAPWYEDLLEIADEIDAYSADEDEGGYEEPEDGMGSYFSRN